MLLPYAQCNVARTRTPFRSVPGATVLKTVPYFFMLRRVALKAHGAHQEDGLHDVIHVGWLPNAPAERTANVLPPISDHAYRGPPTSTLRSAPARTRLCP